MCGIRAHADRSRVHPVSFARTSLACKQAHALRHVYGMLQALIDGQVLCVHGGLSPDLRTLDQVGIMPNMLNCSQRFYGAILLLCKSSVPFVLSVSDNSQHSAAATSIHHTDRQHALHS